jgi:hypothetical protein
MSSEKVVANHLQYSDDDMTAVGRALMKVLSDRHCHSFLKNWHPADCPSEVINDLLNALDEAEQGEADAKAAYQSAFDRWQEAAARPGAMQERLAISEWLYARADRLMPIANGLRGRGDQIGAMTVDRQAQGLRELAASIGSGAHEVRQSG